MKKWLMRLGFAAAFAFLALTVVNASWLAETPRGKVKLVSHGGVGQYFDRTELAAGECPATRIEEQSHPYLENTLSGTSRAGDFGVRMMAVDLQRTRDGELAVFGDDTLDCFTNGTGPVSARTMAELAALDAAYGYSDDGGTSFPLRGTGVGKIRPVRDMVNVNGKMRAMLFRFGSNDAAEADLLIAKLREAGRDPVQSKDAFVGPAAPIARIRALLPDAWAFTPEDGHQCAADYVLTGWYGALPDSCKGGTMLIPVDEQWKFWGWPNRLIQRMAEQGGTVMVTGPDAAYDTLTGLTMPEQLGDVPDSFNGWLLVDDSWNVIPALNPLRDGRGDVQREAAIRALEARRAK